MHEYELLVRDLSRAAEEKDYEALRRFVAEDLEAWSPSYQLSSADEFVEAIRTQNDVATNISTTLVVDVAGSKVFWESVWTGTYPALGKTISLRGLSVGEVEDGRLKRIRQYWDQMAAMTDLGLLPDTS